MLVCAYDIGGTKIEAGLFRLGPKENDSSLFYSLKETYLNTILRKRVATHRDRGYHSIIETMVTLLTDLIAEAQISLEQIAAICLGLPGTVHPKSLIMLNGNTQVLANQSILKDLSQLLSYSGKFFAANDANCFALAEALLGVGQLFKIQHKVPLQNQIGLGVILGTGVGGGIILNGKCFSGKAGGAAEFGHICLDPNGPECFCGRKGCAELYLSGPGLNHLIQSEFKLDWNSYQLFEKIKQKNPQATQILTRYQHYLVEFLANLTNLFDPHYIVIGGGLSNQEAIYPGLKEQLSDKIFSKQAPPIVTKNHLGDSAGIFGSALLAL